MTEKEPDFLPGPGEWETIQEEDSLIDAAALAIANLAFSPHTLPQAREILVESLEHLRTLYWDMADHPNAGNEFNSVLEQGQRAITEIDGLRTILSSDIGLDVKRQLLDSAIKIRQSRLESGHIGVAAQFDSLIDDWSRQPYI